MNWPKSGITVMMVDDDALDCRLVKQAIAKADKSVNFISYENGAEALEALSRRSDERSLPQVCLLDMHMPGLLGIEVLQAMKSDQRFRHIPVIMFSSSDREEDIAACYNCHAAGYIKKPEQHSALEETILNLTTLWAQHMRFTPPN